MPAEQTLYQALQRHAREWPGKAALRCGGTALSYRDLLAEVDRTVPGEAWAALNDGDKLGFVVRYLSYVKSGLPVVIGEPLAVVPGVQRLPGAEVMYTSGSSGEPKAVLLDGAAMYRKALHINEFLGNRPDDTELLTLPLRHSFGLGRLRCALANGQTVLLVENAWLPDMLLHEARRYAPAGLALVSSSVKLLLSRYARLLEQTPVAYLEIGSEPLELVHRTELARLLPNTRIAMHYGMTESSRIAMVDLHQPPGAAGAGHPLPDVEVGVHDGEIRVRGGATLRGYVRDGVIEPVAPNAWFGTGDAGALDAQGLTVTGRLSNTMKMLGKNVSLEFTEHAIRTVLTGADCVCVPRELLPGVLVMVAFIEAENFGQDERSALFGQLKTWLPAHQLPREITAVARLPRLANGKIDRRGASALVSRQ